MRPPIGWHPFRGWGRESEKFGWSEGARENEAEEGRGGISMLPYLMNAAEAPIQNADWRIGEEGKSRGSSGLVGVLEGNLADSNINGRRQERKGEREARFMAGRK